MARFYRGGNGQFRRDTTSGLFVAVSGVMPPPIPPTVSISDGSPFPRTEGTGNIQKVVTLSGITVYDVTGVINTVDGTAVGGVNFTAKVNTPWTIPVGQQQVTITIVVQNPAGYHGTKNFTSVISDVLWNGEALEITDATGAASIADDESPPVGAFTLVAQGNNTFLAALNEAVAQLALFARIPRSTIAAGTIVVTGTGSLPTTITGLKGSTTYAVSGTSLSVSSGSLTTDPDGHLSLVLAFGASPTTVTIGEA